MSGVQSMAKSKIETIKLTPEMAAQLLEHNTLNRPLSQNHVERIARQISEDKWMFNGDTIKVAESGDVLDGQHRLWAVVEAKKPIETILVHGIKRDAFATIDTLRRLRSGGDTLALNGVARYRSVTSDTLKWLVRWQRKCIETFRDPANRVENSDVEEAYSNNPQIVRAVEQAMKVRSLRSTSLIAFMYYVLSNRSSDLAERMLNTLFDPSGVSLNDPFYRLRAYLTTEGHKTKNPVVVIALMIKAANAAAKGHKLNMLAWKHQGQKVEDFPKLDV